MRVKKLLCWAVEWVKASCRAWETGGGLSLGLRIPIIIVIMACSMGMDIAMDVDSIIVIIDRVQNRKWVPRYRNRSLPTSSSTHHPSTSTV